MEVLARQPAPPASRGGAVRVLQDLFLRRRGLASLRFASWRYANRPGWRVAAVRSPVAMNSGAACARVDWASGLNCLNLEPLGLLWLPPLPPEAERSQAHKRGWGALSCRPQSGLSPAFFTLSRSAQALLEPQREAPALSQREREQRREREQGREQETEAVEKASLLSPSPSPAGGRGQGWGCRPSEPTLRRRLPPAGSRRRAGPDAPVPPAPGRSGSGTNRRA